MNEQEVLEMIAAGDDAYDILTRAMPGVERRFKRVCASIDKLMADIKEEFPDACYYTASGGFNIMLGEPHAQGLYGGRDGKSQQELVALGGFLKCRIGDGDF